MSKKGFTLVELLAVIVILAVVMLIAVTSVGPMMEKSRKSSLATEGISLAKAVVGRYNEELLKGSNSEFKSTNSVCFSLDYLCENGYYEKGCGSDGYKGSVLLIPKNGKQYTYFWLTNGTYAFLGTSGEEALASDAVDYSEEIDTVLNNCSRFLNIPTVSIDGTSVNTIPNSAEHDELNTMSSFVYISNESYILGDANNDGELNVIDIVRLKKNLSKVSELTDMEFMASDINCDRKIDDDDLTSLKHHFVNDTIITCP